MTLFAHTPIASIQSRRWTLSGANPLLWFDAADVATFSYGTGSSVAGWSNKGSAGGSFTQGVGTNQPTYSASDLGYPGVRLDGVNDYMTMTPPAAPAAMEFFFVLRRDADPPTVATSGAWDFGGDTANGTVLPFNNGVIYDATGSTTRKITVNPAASMASQCVYSVVSTASEWTSYMNGAQIFTTGTNAVALGHNGNIWLGPCVVGTTLYYYFAGVFREIVAFPTKLSTADRASMIDYCRTKWGTP